MAPLYMINVLFFPFLWDAEAAQLHVSTIFSLTSLCSTRDDWGARAQMFSAQSAHTSGLMFAANWKIAAAPSSEFFGSWPPRWYQDAVELGCAMIRDGARGPDIVRALLGLVSGRDTPAYTAYAAPIISDIAGHFHVVPPAVPGVASTPGLAVFSGTMSPSRLDDWAEYVEYSILLEFFQERYPTSSGLWDRQVRRGVDPTAPIQATAEAGENAAEFNRLVAQGKRRPTRPQAPSHHTPWTRRVLDDIYNFHAHGYRVQGLLPAVAMHVDDRDYGSSAGWAHRQLHIIKALSGDIHNATSSVPPACFEQWAQDTERTLWALCSEGRGAASGREGPRRVLVGLAMGLCGRTLSAGWYFALMPVLTMGQVDDEAEPAHQDLHLPQWMMAAVQTGESLQRRGVDGRELLGHLHAAVACREVPHYHEFALQLLQILRILLEIPAVAHHPGGSGAGRGGVDGVC